jgi:hypothetical protein
MTFLVWAAIGFAVGAALAGRPLVILYLVGAAAIDMRPLWGVVGAIAAVVGGLIATQLHGSSPIPISVDLGATWSAILDVFLATKIELGPVMGAIVAVLVVRCGTAVFTGLGRAARRSLDPGRLASQPQSASRP